MSRLRVSVFALCTSKASQGSTEESSIGDIRTDQVKTNEATDDTRPTARAHTHTQTETQTETETDQRHSHRHILGASLL
jgi:hypothetical protein